MIVIMEVHNDGDCGHQVVVMLIMALHGGMDTRDR